MENQLLLPQEVAQIAEGVSVEKRTEVEAEAERKAKEAAELKSKNAPDKEKLLAFVETLKWLPLPELQEQAAKDILGEAILNITLVYAAIEKKCAEL